MTQERRKELTEVAVAMAVVLASALALGGMFQGTFPDTPQFQVENHRPPDPSVP